MVVPAVVVETSVASACDTDADADADADADDDAGAAGGSGARRLGWVRRMSEMISRAMTCSVSWPLLKQ